MKAVILDKQTLSSKVNLDSLSDVVSSLICYELTTENQLIERCIDADIIITNKVLLTDAIIAQLPQLKLICIAATGTNNVDLIAAKNRNIAVTNVSGYSKNSVAQYVFSQMLAYYSQTDHHQKNVEQGLWQNSQTFCFHGNGSTELANKTLGIIGYGNLGQAVANIANAFNMNVLIAERPLETNIRDGRFSFSYVIQNADIITLHCPLTDQTKDLFDYSIFKQMKSSALLINAARGQIVNEQDLLNALIKKDIAYAVLDVLTQEPPEKSNPLLLNQLPNLKITAHIAWASIEAQQKLVDLIAINISDFKQGKRTNRVE